MADETPVWPPTIPRGKPIPKPSAAARKAEKKADRAKVATQERDNKQEAKRRDSYRCRFPSCGCKRLALPLEASHWRQHKGMGGDPRGLRSDVEDLITVCNHRHKDGVIAIDKGTLQVRPLDVHRGASGPVEWWMDATAYQGKPGAAEWVRLAREEAPGKLAPGQPLAGALMLQGLSQMVR